MALTTVSNAGLGGSIDLTAKVTGTLPVANGGTATTSYTPGITMAETWKLTTDWSSNSTDDQILTADWSVNSYGGGGNIGSSMTNSTGTFSFPSTGIYLILFQMEMSPTTTNTHDRGMRQSIYTTTDDSSYNQVSFNAFFSNWTQNSNRTFSSNYVSFIFDVTSVSTHKVRFAIGTSQGTTNSAKSDSDIIRTGTTFVRLGDT
jgi:hypothetical protein